jgi:hypothetical protein
MAKLTAAGRKRDAVVLVLSPSQMADERLMAAVREYYPPVEIVQTKSIPTEAHHVRLFPKQREDPSCKA